LLAEMAQDGVLALRDTGAYDDSTVRLAQAERGDVVVTACGRFLAPPGGYFPGVFTGVPAELVAVAAVEQVQAGATWVKVVGDFPPAGDLNRPPEANYDRATLQSLVDAVHAAGGRVAVHVTTPVVTDVVAAGADSVEHGTALDEDTVRTMAARGTAWTPTLGAVLRPVPLGAPPEWAQRRHDRIELMRNLLPLALRHGVPILTGSDVVGTVVQEVALLADLGVPPDAALAAATTSARSFLGLPGLAAGASADLVTYDDDPRADPAVLARPAAVLSRGRRLR
jgi:imidazolonepropionase-like amidohydrolase